MLVYNLQNSEYGSRVTELVLVLLDPDVVSAVVDVDCPVLSPQPHGGLELNVNQWCKSIHK